eukprot:TRINITY_DN5720_c0_g1_i1.p1 TRINITY_DN5720_c0_g1~~TRINITY_DN5720_c0_g1_i1.p1  ORF type:complete len:460 (+),score=82.61 TRINITY_DN5720_c0_g1_i1:169-1548(+)
MATETSHPQYPPNCRIFIGNLASEKTSKEELSDIFARYGKIEEVVIRKSFGFVQYDSTESAEAAIAGENQRIIGGLPIDLNLADNRDRNAGKKRRDAERADRGHNNRDDDRSNRTPYQRDGDRGRDRDRRDDRDSRDRGDYKRSRRQYSPPPLPVACTITFLSPHLRDYADHIERTLAGEIGTFTCETGQIRREDRISDVLNRTRDRGLRYAFVIGRHNESQQSVELHIYRPNTSMQPDDFRNIPLMDAVDLIRKEEQLVSGQRMSLPTGSYINPALAAQINPLSHLQQLPQVGFNNPLLASLMMPGGLPTGYPNVGAAGNFSGAQSSADLQTLQSLLLTLQQNQQRSQQLQLPVQTTSYATSQSPMATQLGSGLGSIGGLQSSVLQGLQNFAASSQPQSSLNQSAYGTSQGSFSGGASFASSSPSMGTASSASAVPPLSNANIALLQQLLQQQKATTQ